MPFNRIPLSFEAKWKDYNGTFYPQTISTRLHNKHIINIIKLKEAITQVFIPNVIQHLFHKSFTTISE